MSRRPVLTVLVSALLFGLSTPLAKLLLKDVPPIALAGFLYLGAFAGLSVYAAIRSLLGRGKASALPLRRRDLPWLAGAIIAGGIVAPILLMFGLTRVTGFAASLLLNLEASMTALMAVVLFKERAGRRTWLALAVMTGAGILLSWDPAAGAFSWAGALLVFLAMAGWGLDNNLTRTISDRDAVRIAQVKGLAAGVFSTALAFFLGQRLAVGPPLLAALAVGALGYGLSLVLFIRALSELGAFRAGAFFAAAPFIGAAASILLLGELPTWTMIPGTALMLLGVVLISGERHVHRHRHERAAHAHLHRHPDGHHLHPHAGPAGGSHAHEHVHDEVEHDHGHWPDLHHRHGH